MVKTLMATLLLAPKVYYAKDVSEKVARCIWCNLEPKQKNKKKTRPETKIYRINTYFLGAVSVYISFCQGCKKAPLGSKKTIYP